MSNILNTIGNTPIVELKNIEKKFQLKSKIFAKLELENPTGSVKDRAALKMVEDAINNNILKEDSIIVEATSGNMGISLAFIGKQKNLGVIIVMPSNMSEERILMMKKYGASVILTSSSLGMKGSVNKVKDLIKDNDKIVYLNQFTNLSNKYAHHITGKEIIEQVPDIDIFVTGIGTGGTISGVGEVLKQKDKNIKIIGVEPECSPLIKKGYYGNHKIQGIGPNFIPNIFNKEVVDEIQLVSDSDAYKYTNILFEEENIFCGISSGANLKAAIEIAKIENNKKIVIIIQDKRDRYYSVNL